MKERQFKRAVALLLSLCMCLSCLPAAVFAEEGEKETQSWTETEEQTLEDASAQLGEYTPPAADSEQEAEPPAEEPAAEPEAPAETTEASRTEEPEAEPEQAPAAAVSPSAPVRGNMPNEGRTSADQQVLTLDDGTEFILIGTKQQLTQGLDYYPTSLANMTDSVAEENRPVVMGPIWRVHYQRTGVLDSDWRKVGEELVYPGDNNLRSDVTYKDGSGTTTGDFSSYSLYGMPDEGIKNGNGTGWKIGQTQELDWFSPFLGGGSKDEWRYVGGTLLGGPDESIDSYGYGHYSQRNNYVVFRNIKLNEDNDTTPNWDPLMFYGLMYGVNGSALTDKTLEDAVREIRASDDASDYTYHEVNNTAGFVKPKISNVYVVTSTENRMLDQNKYVGVGFFATVTSSRPGASNGLTHIKAEVRNLELDNVHITNNYEGIHVDETVLSGLLSLAGTGVGYLLDGLLQVLTGKDMTGFHDSLKDLLTARAKDKTNLATGSFAGRVYGDVLIENCDVVTATVTSNKSYVGGFVGYSVGEEQYDGLSNTLNSLLKLLTTVLNVVPGLGLGDLISVVRNLLPVNTLIPVDYYNPRFESCKLTDLSGDIGPSALTWTFVVEDLPNETADAEFNGGFIGCKVATVMINCGVEDSDYTVYAKNYGGGFAGIARDAVIQELLSDLGIKFESAITRLMDAGVDLQSVQVHCYIKDSTVEVNGENYLGGFNGAMTFAYSVNNEMKSKGETLTVNGTGDCIGGYTGSATLGWAMSMGERESAGTTSLLETVKNLVGSLVENYGSELLNLSGVGQSEILGLQFDYAQAKVNGSYVGGEASVTGHDYVGGLVGKADALIMTGTTAESLQRTTYFEHGDLSVHDIFPNLDQDTEFTVTLYEYGSVTSDPNNSDYIVTDDENYLYTIPAPNNASPNNYTFVGWTTEHYDHTVNKPEKIYAVGDSVLITHDTTFNALYAKEGDPVFELITRTPENWETAYPSYIITYGCKESEMMVLTGLNDNVNYEDSDSGGATDLATIRNGDTTVFAFLNTFQITNVPDLYRFTANQVARTNDFYFQNIGKQTYLRRDLNGTVYRLEASSNNLLAGTQWHPSIGSELNVLFENDLLSLTNNKDKIVYNNTKNYFCMGTTEDANTEAKKIYIWGETKLPTKYTTVADGADIPSVSTTVELDESLVQEYASVNVYGLRQVNGHKFVGGIAGLAGTASVGGLLNDTIGIGDFKKFEFVNVNVVGGTVYTRDANTGEALTGNDGLRVLGLVPNAIGDNGAGYYVGGGVGMAVGGDLHNIDLSWLNQVEGVNCVGGFIGCAGPGDLIGTGGLNLQLLGLSLLTANNLLAVGQGIVTDPRHCTVTGVSDGYTVEATGENDLNEVIIYCAGGFFGRSNSTTADDCHAKRILWVKANNDDGRAGGFIGVSQVGGLASMSDAQGTQVANLITRENGVVSASNLINAIGYLIPTYTKVDASYVDDGYVEAAWAGGFAADFESGTVDNSAKAEGDWYAVYNIDHVDGVLYAGGFGGKVYSGALADAGGGISILGGLSNVNIGASDLLRLINAYIPKIIKAGVKSDLTTKSASGAMAEADTHNGFIVTVSSANDDKTTGAAGGFIGYGSGAQVSYSDVTLLRHTEVTPPAELEGQNGDSYYDVRSAYAVTGTRYAGGYAGFLDVGSAASIGRGLNVLGENLSVTNVTEALNVVVSTVEHSDVYGAPGGFAVKATWTAEEEAEGEDPGAESNSVVTVYVVDENDCADFYAYIFNSDSDSNDGQSLPGHKLTSLGTVRNTTHKYYSFTVDKDVYDRVIFNDGASHQTNNENCLHLDSENNAVVVDGILPVYVYPDNGWKVSAEGADIWPASDDVHESCRGTYTHYISVMDKEEDIETVTGNSKAHKFSVWTPVDGVNKHYHVCTVCGYRELDQDCTFPEGSDFCSVCGRRNAELPDSISEKAGLVGRAGGFVGWLRGSHIQDSSSYNFSYIVGQIAAGGYAGEIEPGSVADALGPTNLLEGLVSTQDSLLSVAQDFVPSIRNSETTCIPCGGAVRANAASDAETQRGMAGGFVGHNSGGQIWGNNTKPWKRYDGENQLISSSLTDPYLVPQGRPLKECRAVRILSVYGYEYGGGFTGLMESANTADTGSLSLLWGLVDANNLLGALKIVYPTEENTAVYGPLYGLDRTTWNTWVEYIGQYGGYGLGMEQYNDDASFEAALPNYLYGYHVAAGRDEYVTEAIQVKGGYAGGYVGAMRTGTITNGQAHNAKQVTAMHAAGGFAGEMSAGGAAELGSVSLLGLNLDLTSLIDDVLDVFVPCVKNSSVHGYQSGLTVCAFGDKNNTDENQNNLTHRLGDAGGYVGAMSGGQIWGDAADAANANGGCNVENLKKVQGVRHVGGYAGSIRSGSAADVNTNTDDGLFQGILDSVISTPDSLVKLLKATLSTIRNAQITVADPEWGYTVGGMDGALPECAGGFAGSASGAVLGKQDGATRLTVNDLRGVAASEYAGGFVGLADVDGLATVADKGNTNVLDLVQLGQTSLVDTFRPYIYYADVNGVSDGFTVKVEESEEAQQGLMASIVYTGCAGGFGGAVKDGTVEHSNVTQLSSVTGPNYVGGFIGFCGKSGVADVDNANVLGSLVGLQAGVGDAFGSTVTACTVTGIRRTENSNSVEIGYTVTANGKTQPIAGGFVGYGDLAQMDDCHASSLKYVESAGIAGGFIGRTSLAYLVEVQAGGTLLNTIVFIVNALLDVLNVGDLENLGVISLNLNPVLNLDVLTDGDLLYVDLLGLKIGVALNSDNTAAKVTIGDSYIELPVDENGDISADDMPSNLTVRLIRINHTRTDDCTVTGVPAGYDVFGGGASQTEDGTDVNGCAGGFVGFNDESSFVGCQAIKCDVVRGTEDLVGPFSGKTKHDSVYASQSVTAMEGSGNSYNGISHNPSSQNTSVYESPAKVVLMDDEALPANLQTMVPETADMQNPCLNRVDLTLHKVWDDMDGALGQRRDADAEHPVTVTFTVTRVSKDANGAVIANSETTVQTVTLTDIDANPFTKNVWTKKLTGLPATGTENGATVWYSYSVTEAALSGYVSGTEYADYDVTDKLTFGHTTDAEHTVDGGYVAKLTNQAAAEQTIVVDFGLPVSIRVMDYLKAKFEYPVSGMSVVGILPVNSLQNVSRFSTQKDGSEQIASELDVNPDNAGNPTPAAPAAENRVKQYGTFAVPALGEGETAITKLRYIPGSMMFDQPIEIAAALLGADGAYYYTRIKVIPATMIYYEAEDFFDEFYGNWDDVTEPSTGSESEPEQDEDRPGADVTDYDNIYGYDAQYSNSATYSLGAAKKITVRAGDRPYAKFTFKGTGFDILAVTNSGTGFMTVQVYQGDTVDPNRLAASWSVNCYYGCTRQLSGAIRYLYVWDGEAADPITGENTGCWRVAKSSVSVADYNAIQSQLAALEEGRELTENGIPVLTGCPNSDKLSAYQTNGFIVYKLNYEWITNPTEEGESPVTLYQVPVITSRFTKIKVYSEDPSNPEQTSYEKKLMPYGTYTVVLKPIYTAFYDNNSAGSYDVYLDGVRIYGPAQGEEVESVYLEDHEGWPQFLEMRRLLLGQNSFGQIPDASNSNVIYIDGGITDMSLEDFRQYGPNHEIYLEPDQAIAFSLQKGSAETLVDRLHISMKRIIPGDSSQVTISCGPTADAKSAVIDLNTSSECYYDLTDIIQWTGNQTGLIVISNSGRSTVSLDNLKVTYSSNPVPDVLDAGVTEDNLAEHYLVTVAPIQPQASLEALRLLNRAASLPIVLDDDPAFLGASISLESDFSLHFYIPAALLADKSNPRVIFTKQTADGPVTVCQYDYVEELVGDTLCRRYSFHKLSAAEMGTEVTARLFYNGEGEDHMSSALTYSVKQYAMNMLGKTDDQVLRTLLTDMLNYGAEAQKYFGVNADKLVNAELSEAEQACATAAEPVLTNQKRLISQVGAKVWFEGCSLSLERNVTINYYLDLSTSGLSADEVTLELSWTEADGSQRTAVIDGSDFETRQLGGRTLYLAVLDELNAAQMRTVVSAVVRGKSDQSRISDTMCYSIESYAQSKVNNPALASLILAMMKYGDAAEAYFRVH